MTLQIDATVITAGVNRLACDARLAGRGLQTVLLEKESKIGPLEAIHSPPLEKGCNIGLLSRREAIELEPELRCSAALLAPDTWIVDSHGLMDGLLADFESAGGMFVRCAAVRRGNSLANGSLLELDDGEETRMPASQVVNAAGIDGPVGAATRGGFSAPLVPPRCFATGSYSSHSGKSPFARLIYPVPEAGGQGVHRTIDLK